MIRMLSSREVAEAMDVSMETARSYMRKMIHTEKPLRVTEDAFRAWIGQRTYTTEKISARAEKAIRRSEQLPDRIPRRRRGSA